MREPAWFSCTATLLDADTFPTLGHRTDDIGTGGLDSEATSGGTDVWVALGAIRHAEVSPARADDETREALDEARPGWLEANPDFSSGTASPPPAPRRRLRFPDHLDVVVLELDEAAAVTTYGPLAPLGTIATLAGTTGRGRNDVIVETDGYGVRAVQRNPSDVATRSRSTSLASSR